jgi:hypothetical protein
VRKAVVVDSVETTYAVALQTGCIDVVATLLIDALHSSHREEDLR